MRFLQQVARSRKRSHLSPNPSPKGGGELPSPFRGGVGGELRGRSCRGSQACRFRPQLEALEDRQLLSSFLVVLGTDNGGPAGQKVSATSGDLRYCVEQADAVHAATTDTISFSPALTSTPRTITCDQRDGPFFLSDSHPLTINGPTTHTLNVSGGSHIEVFDVAGGTVTMKNLAIIYGFAASAIGGPPTNGGGIFNQGNLSLFDCILDHDVSSGDGGGIFNTGTAALTACTLYLDSAVQGGGIANETPAAVAVLTKCNLSNDLASNNGGGMYNSGTATLINCTLGNDLALGVAVNQGFGGGICNNRTATLNNCTLRDDAVLSASGVGGGMYNNANAALTMCTLSNDSANQGGGIWNDGTATLTNCTLSNDTSGGVGGGGGGIANTSFLVLTNCTLANDSTGVDGGGLANIGTAFLTNCTLSDNFAGVQGGGIYNSNSNGSLHLTNTIVAGNSALTQGQDVFNFGTITADHDLIGDGTNSGISNGGGNIVGGNGNPIDARLGPLQNNGGPTETMALLPDSPAIGQADNTQAPATDQRGFLRLDEAGETTDIGAFEF